VVLVVVGEREVVGEGVCRRLDTVHIGRAALGCFLLFVLDLLFCSCSSSSSFSPLLFFVFAFLFFSCCSLGAGFI
jgi:hypothetical protein